MAKSTIITGDNVQKSSLLWGIKPKAYSMKNRRFWNEWNFGVLFIYLAFLCSAVVFSVIYGFEFISMEMMLNITLDFVALILALLMFISCTRTANFDKTTVSFIFLLNFCSLYNYLDIIFWLINGNAGWRWLSVAVDFLYFVCPVLMTCLFFHFVESLADAPKRKSRGTRRIVNVLTIAAVASMVVNLFGGFFYTVSDSGTYIRNPETYYLSFVLPTALLVSCAVFICLQKLILSDKVMLILYLLLPYASSLFTIFLPETTFTTSLSFLSIFIIYINLFIRRERELEINQKELAESKINAMILQINPHFIYNTLGTIGGLCSEEPEKARKMIGTFSHYLRNNLGEMAQKPMIPFEKEVEHLKYYIEIEKQRFPDIEVTLNIGPTDFDLPSLSIQPLVENAITHGIMGRESGGSVTISSYEDKNFYFVQVGDDGVGFREIPKNDGKNHIGIANVASRLKMLCDGELVIDSVVGTGTTALVKIPKGRKK